VYLFWRLLLAHLIGDFVLQTDTIYKKKISGAWGEILHAQIVGIVLVLFSWPYLGYLSVWLMIFSFVIVHVFIDRFKMRFTSKRLSSFWAFTLDQALHVLTFFPIFLFGYSHKPHLMRSYFLRWYNDNVIVIALSGFILASFGGTYLLHNFKKTYLKQYLNEPLPSMVNYGLFERMFIYLAMLTIPRISAVIIAMLAGVRIMRKSDCREFLLNLFYAVLIFLCVRGLT
jgi:hypothetical protein